MKIGTLTLALLLAAPVAAIAGNKETQTRIHGRTVTVITETTTQAPAACQCALDQQLVQLGWHDEIYRTVKDDKAVVVFSERKADPCSLTEVKVKLWKAVAVAGKTVTETRVYTLRPAEVNAFLDHELPQLTTEFAGLPVRAS